MTDQHIQARFMTMGLALFAVACLGQGSEAGGQGVGEAIDEAGETSEGDAADGVGEANEDEGGTESMPLEPCTAVDVLFVIDNSDTMADEQARLLASATGFIDSAAKLLPAELDFHVGVITTDSADLVREGPGGQPCPFVAEGAPYMVHTGAISSTLDAGLACAATVGTKGSPDERPIEMALNALGPEANVLGGPNAGFVREGAVLVLVLLTDEEDDHETVTQWGSPGEPQDWAEALSGIVFGLDERVVVTSLIGHAKPNACPGFQWDGSEGAELAPRLAAFTQSFEHAMVGDVCANSYANLFADAAFVVAAACSL